MIRNRAVEFARRTDSLCRSPIIKATVKRFQEDHKNQLRRHFDYFFVAFSQGRCLKAAKGLTPYNFIFKQRTSKPDRFKLNPIIKKSSNAQTKRQSRRC